MAELPKFNFALATLIKSGDLILTAAEKYATDIDPRLPDGFTAAARALVGVINTQDVKQKSDAGDLGTLTLDQDAKLNVLVEKITAARETAKKAFKGNDVKLREEFQVTINTPSGLGDILRRARIILAALQKAENAAALKGKGWIAADTAAFAAAIDALNSTDDVQETAKTIKTGSTGERNRQANQFYDNLLAIQNAASLQWPASNPANASKRAEFLLETFPPRSGGGKTSPTPPTPTPPPA